MGLTRLLQGALREEWDALSAPEAPEQGLSRPECVDALLEHPDEPLPRSGASALGQAAVLELRLQEQGVR